MFGGAVTEMRAAPSAGCCAAVWVKVAGQSLKCGVGDSGGPFFSGSWAYGMMQGGGFAGGQCSYATFNSVGAMSSMGLQLLFE